MATKQSRAALIRLVETGLRDVGSISSDKFFVLVRDINVSGSPPSHIVAAVLVRFLPAGAPFCCGEPGCYSRVFIETEELGDYLRRRMNFRHSVRIELNCTVEYFDGIEFTAIHE